MIDLKFAFRQLLKNPGFTAVAVLTLRVGLVIFRSVRPGKPRLLFGVQPPDDQPGRHDPNHRAHAFCVSVESRVTQEAPDKVRHLILPDRQGDQTVPGMTERTSGQTQIAREKRRRVKGQQKGKNVLVRHALVR